MYYLLPCAVCVDSNLELYKEFAEEAFSIALHPSGLYICVGFSDKLRLMNLLIDDIRTFKEFPIRGCKEVSLNLKSNWRFSGIILIIYSELIQSVISSIFSFIFGQKFV